MSERQRWFNHLNDTINDMRNQNKVLRDENTALALRCAELTTENARLLRRGPQAEPNIGGGIDA